MGEVLLEALLDTLKILPFILIMNFVIELIEYRSKGLKADKILKGGFAPLIGAAVGTVPQCGFSVVATELYSKRRIALGTLLAVYLATSDEALPIMLSSYAGITKVLPVLIIKICFALVVGYSAFAIEKIAARLKSGKAAAADEAQADCTVASKHCADDGGHDHEHEHEHSHEHDNEHDDGDEHVRVHIHGCHHHALEEADTALGKDATKKQKAAHVWNVYFKHPILHTATVILFIFIVNVVLGVVVFYVGEDRLAAFISRTGYFQPVLSALVGLIPNCAASVVITELYVLDKLSLGGAVAGLCVSAGIGYAVLVKQNRPIKNTVAIIVIAYVLSVALGICITALGF